jgi:membrane-bound lytic murein transglycosylase B
MTEAEAAIRDAQLDESIAPAWGRRQQLLYRLLAVNEQWATEAIAAIDEPLRSAVAANWRARQELSRLVAGGELSSVLPAWRIREPLPVAELRSYYDEASATTGIAWEYLAAINLIETRMGRIEGLSTAGATGPMQFLPSTWDECCEGDPTIDRDAIIGAAVYLRARGGPDDMGRALLGYNNSEYYVNAVSAYAEVLRADPMALRGYHAWEVFFRSELALVRLPVGYEQLEPIDALEWIAANPEHVID